MPRKQTIMENSLWIARDKDKTLYLYIGKPIRYAETFGAQDFVEDMTTNEPVIFLFSADLYFRLDERLYPAVTWENSPFELTIKSENNGK